ncbi:hypothetical protein GGR57DRAFT_501930 [Xylariaceae sp. FL1272]|nr:hypothetical protein GGR57DRAFT_501930 [Xylariaceae sp. FL1272]
MALLLADASAHPKQDRNAPEDKIAKRQWGYAACQQNLDKWPPAPIKPLLNDSDTSAYSVIHGWQNEVIISAQQCRQVWCGKGASVVVCNDDLGFIQLWCDDIAEAMKYLVDYCPMPDNSSMAQGQLITTNPWNLIVRGDTDCFWGETPTWG